MFPEGRAGIALVLMRISVSATLLIYALAQFPAPLPQWQCLALIVLSACVGIGLMTPLFSVLSCIVGLARLLGWGETPVSIDVLSTLNAAALALLGPGAYSLDARLFGRRVVMLPVNEEQDDHTDQHR